MKTQKKKFILSKKKNQIFWEHGANMLLDKYHLDLGMATDQIGVEFCSA